MKRILVLIAVALVAVGSVIAEEAVLIDFTQLTVDSDGQNSATFMDYATSAGGSYTDDQKAAMKTSLAITNWDVVFTASSRRAENVSISRVEEAPSRQYGTVMGVRIHFPLESWNSTADIRPPFEIPYTVDGKFEDGKGVVRNVGILKEVQVEVYGLNFPHALYSLLIDENGVEREFFMGYLRFDGWGKLTWVNPAYVTDVRNRELRLYPLYPASTPFVKFGGFRIKRDANNLGGDFITYFKDVQIIYDKAVLDTEQDIDNESVWSIITDREAARQKSEFERFGEHQVLEYLETQKQATESFTPAEAPVN
ncbi:MAG: flagellar filament outer layer protein FlaA [Treponema sp.]|jgi:hypothetical protein|nr:flagellar filament outer layer protein FlaA [Treponema sp.]